VIVSFGTLEKAELYETTNLVEMTVARQPNLLESRFAPPNDLEPVHGDEHLMSPVSSVAMIASVAVAKRYRTAGRVEKGRILDELTATTGWHRKHAVRALSTAGRTGASPQTCKQYQQLNTTPISWFVPPKCACVDLSERALIGQSAERITASQDCGAL
jgi:hypothetical protein